ncbi:hypothetical protein Tco_0635903 [Tanacetum coccineum]
MNHKVVGVIHEKRKKARINLKTGLKGRVNILLIKGVIGDETERRNKNKSKQSGRRNEGWIIQIFQKLMFVNYDQRVVNFEKKKGKLRSGFPAAAMRMDTLNDIFAASDLISLHYALNE